MGQVKLTLNLLVEPQTSGMTRQIMATFLEEEDAFLSALEKVLQTLPPQSPGYMLLSDMWKTWQPDKAPLAGSSVSDMGATTTVPADGGKEDNTMTITKLWVYDGHRKTLGKALSQTCAIRPNGTLDLEYTAALYLLTGLEDAWNRLSQYVTMEGLNFQTMLNEVPLSTGEEMIVSLAYNLFNCYAPVKFTPSDLVDRLDNDAWELAMNGLMLRRGTPKLDMLGLVNG